MWIIWCKWSLLLAVWVEVNKFLLLLLTKVLEILCRTWVWGITSASEYKRAGGDCRTVSPHLSCWRKVDSSFTAGTCGLNLIFRACFSGVYTFCILARRCTFHSSSHYLEIIWRNLILIFSNNITLAKIYFPLYKVQLWERKVNLLHKKRREV